MLATARQAFSGLQRRAFSSTSSRSYDLAKLILIGRLGREPELRSTKNGKEYVFYTVATTNFPPPPPNPDGSRASDVSTWHHIVSFSPGQNNYLRSLAKGSRVYVEANYELRDPEPGADPSAPEGRRNIFLRHESIRVLQPPYNPSERQPPESEE